MLEFRKKNRFKKVLYSPITIIFLVIVFIFMFKGTWGVYNKDKISLIKLEQERNELKKIVERQKNLQAALAYLSTDRGIENEIRSKFRAVKEGEKVSVIIDEQKPESTTSTSTKKGFWNKIFDWL